MGENKRGCDGIVTVEKELDLETAEETRSLVYDA